MVFILCSFLPVLLLKVRMNNRCHSIFNDSWVYFRLPPTQQTASSQTGTPDWLQCCVNLFPWLIEICPNPKAYSIFVGHRNNGDRYLRFVFTGRPETRPRTVRRAGAGMGAKHDKKNIKDISWIENIYENHKKKQALQKNSFALFMAWTCQCFRRQHECQSMREILVSACIICKYLFISTRFDFGCEVSTNSDNSQRNLNIYMSIEWDIVKLKEMNSMETGHWAHSALKIDYAFL